MALSLVNANLAWQRAKIALDTEPSGAGSATPPPAVAAFKALKEYLATVKSNPDLELVPISNTDIDDASGKVLADVACTLYGVFLKKLDTATDVYVHILDDATDDTGVATDTRVLLAMLEAEETVFAIAPQGIPMAAGVVAKAYTTAAGTTDSTATDCPNGFVIIGAA